MQGIRPEKALFTSDNPIAELGINDAQVLEVPVSSMTKAALAESGLDLKSVMKCRNIFTLGLVCWLFDRPLESALRMLRNKFAKNRPSTKQTPEYSARATTTDTTSTRQYRHTA